MRKRINRTLARTQRTFAAFTIGQKLVAIIGTAALLLGGFIVFRWAAAPSYAPLFSGLEPKDASAIIDELDSRGVAYQLGDGGTTIMVPRNEVYRTRIALSGEGLPSQASSGYSILDGQGLSTSQFQEQTDFKRAMEGELARTIEAIDTVDTAVVHLAIPQKQVFADEQDPTTASVLVDTQAGRTLAAGQVQAIVNLVAASIDGLSPENVTVADSTGTVLSAPGGTVADSVGSQAQQVQAFQEQIRGQVQAVLDRVLGPGNSAVQVTANLSFDKRTVRTTRYFDTPLTLSSTETTEKSGGAGGAAASGVVGQTPSPTSTATASPTPSTAASEYSKTTRTAENAVNQTVEEREAAPGGVESLHIGVVLDQAALDGVAPDQVQELITSALGISTTRGDTVTVTSLPFDRSAEQAAAAELEAAAAAEGRARLTTMARNGLLILLVVFIAFAAWVRSRRHRSTRDSVSALSWVEQLRVDEQDAQATQSVAGASPAMLALQASEQERTAEIRAEVASLAGSQPQDVAALLRGWLVEQQ